MNCMWYTMEQLSGWPSHTEEPLSCDSIDMKWDASLICNVIEMYKCRGPTACWGTDADRATAEQCLRTKCPTEAAAADRVLSTPGTQCPINSGQNSVALASPSAPLKWNGMWDGHLPHLEASSKSSAVFLAIGAGVSVTLLAFVAAIAFHRRVRGSTARAPTPMSADDEMGEDIE